MKYRVAGRIAAASIAALSFATVAAPAQAGEKIANSYICVFKKDAVGKADVEGKANAAAHAHGGNVSHVFKNSIRGFSANMSEQGMTNMRRNNPSIAYCEQDQVMSLVAVAKGKPGGGGTPTPTGQETPPGITAVNGGGATYTGAGVAWIIDTGIDSAHPDLNVAASRGAYFAGRSVEDENGHGTHVSGTIAARSDNNLGVVGVAPGATVIPVRVLDRRGSGANSGVIAGVDFVAAHGKSGDVANMSLGGGVSTALDQAVVDAAATGVKFALAAGNESDNANNHSPARANGPNVYTVSAVDSVKKFAYFSNYGNPPIDYAEPGVNIKSTWLGGGYNTISGTSMATPHLAGILLLGTGVRSGGTVSGDPDNNPDTFGVH